MVISACQVVDGRENTKRGKTMILRICSLLRVKPPAVEAPGLLLASGASVPADEASGYQTGCIFQHTDGGAGTALYVNEGTYASCDFNAVTVGA